MQEYKYSVFIAYWGTENVHGSYARARAIKRDVEESLALPLPYINSNTNDVLFTEHKDSTIQDSKLFLLVLNSDCPTTPSGHIDEDRCSALCEEITTFISLIKEKKRFAKDFAIYFESNAIEQTAQFAYLKRLLQKIDPDGVLVNGNSNFHLKSTMQILNWINDRWAVGQNTPPSQKTASFALGDVFFMAYTFSKSLFSFPIPRQNDLKGDQDFILSIRAAKNLLDFYQPQIGARQKSLLDNAYFSLQRLTEYFDQLNEELPTAYIRELAEIYTNLLDTVVGPIIPLLSRNELLIIKTGGFLGLLFKWKAFSLAEDNDYTSDMESCAQMILSNLPQLKIKPETAEKIRVALLDLPYSHFEEDFSRIDMLCDFVVNDLNLI